MNVFWKAFKKNREYEPIWNFQTVHFSKRWEYHLLQFITVWLRNHHFYMPFCYWNTWNSHKSNIRKSWKASSWKVSFQRFLESFSDKQGIWINIKFPYSTFFWKIRTPSFEIYNCTVTGYSFSYPILHIKNMNFWLNR